MPYLWYPPTFLALPLEIRCLIYSHLLIYKASDLPHLIDMNIHKPDETYRTVRNMFLICQQVHREAFEYYYTNNSFILSLITPYYSLKEIAAQSDMLLTRLRFVQSLQILIHTVDELPAGFKGGNLDLSDIFGHDSKFPKQQEQWICFLSLLSKAKEGQSGRKLKDLTIQDWAICRCEGGELDANHPVYRSLLAPIKGEITQIKGHRGPLKYPVRHGNC